MSEIDELLASALKKLLKERLSEAEEQSLKDQGFILKNPTRRAAIAVALYKKAAAGDLSAIKEMRSILCPSGKENTSGEAVTIIDDITNKDI